LIVGPDGKCVICRRGEEVVEAKTSSDWPVVVFSLVMGVAVVGGLGYFLTRKIQRLVANSGQPELVQPVAEATQAPEAPRPATRRTPPIQRDTEPAPIATITPVATLPNPEELEAAKRTVKITFYSGKACPLCDRAREFLTMKSYAFIELDVDQSETDKVLLKSINPGGGVPTFDVEGKVLVGYDRQLLDKEVEKIALKRLKK
jgi:glutaredoxin